MEGVLHERGREGRAQGRGTGRRAAVEKVVEGLGGKVESFHFALGEEDVYVIPELPDAVTATAVSLTVNASGVVALQTVELLTPQ